MHQYYFYLESCELVSLAQGSTLGILAFPSQPLPPPLFTVKVPPLPPFTPTPLFVIEVEPFCLKVTTELKSPRDPEKKIKSKKVIIVFKIEKRLSVTKIQHLNF